MQTRELTSVEYLCLLYIEQSRGEARPMTLLRLEELLHPAPTPEATDNLWQMRLAKMAQHATSGQEQAGTAITTEEGRTALIVQRQMVHTTIEQDIERHQSRALQLRARKVPQESGAKEEERRAGILKTRGERIKRLQIDIFAEMPLTSQHKAMLRGDREFWPGGNPVSVPSATAPVVNQEHDADASDVEEPPAPTPKRNKPGPKPKARVEA